jgi:transcription elongation GreA/GreB family factor
VSMPVTQAKPADALPPGTDHATVELSPVSGVGSTVEAEDLASGLRLTYRLVEPHDAAPKEGRLSVASPVGMVLHARRPGEVVTATTPRGHRRLRIIAVA